jgi:hypothetical protein
MVITEGTWLVEKNEGIKIYYAYALLLLALSLSLFYAQTHTLCQDSCSVAAKSYPIFTVYKCIQHKTISSSLYLSVVMSAHYRHLKHTHFCRKSSCKRHAYTHLSSTRCVQLISLRALVRNNFSRCVFREHFSQDHHVFYTQ